MTIFDIMYNPFNKADIPLPHEDTPAPPYSSEEISIENTSSSSILFRWNVPEGCIKEANYDIEVQYRPFLIRFVSGSLEWDPNSTYVTATRNPPRYQWSSQVYDSNILSKHKDGLLIEVNDLAHANVTYEFVMSIFLYDRQCTTKVRAATKIAAPRDPPRTCTGCFHVFDSGDKQRSVRIYWQEAFEKYHLTVSEEDKILHNYKGRS